MPTVTERLAIVITSDADKAVATFKKLGDSTKGMAGPIGQAGGLMSKFSGQLGGLAKVAGPAALAALGAAVAKFAASGLQAFTDLAAEVKSFQRIAGGTTEDASRLVYAFKAMGIDAQTAAGGVFMLEKRLGTASATLAGFGVQIAKDSKGNTDMAATLLNIADAYSKTADPAARAQLAAAAFGKGAATLVPLLARGREGIKDLYAEAARHGLILSPEDLQRATDLKISMRNLKESVEGLQVTAGRTLIPAVTQVVSLTDKLIQRISEIQSGPEEGSKGGWWDFVTKGLSEVQKTIDKVSGAFPTLAEAPKAATQSMGELTQETTDLNKALQTMVDADRALASSQRGLAADQRSLADAQADYDKLLKQGAVDAEKVADAQRSLADATRAVGHAQREQRDAQRDYDKALAAFNILGTDTAADELRDKADNLADANDNVTSALERQQDAQRDMDKAKAGDPDYQEKLARAKQNVADQTQAVADAEYNVGQNTLKAASAHDAETIALAGKADAIERLLADYDALLAKNPAAAAALMPLINAAQAALGVAKPGAASPLLPTGVQAGGGLLGSSLGQLTTVPATAPPLSSGLLTSGSPVTNNNTFNITAPATIDPLNLSNAILWNLN